MLIDTDDFNLRRKRIKRYTELRYTSCCLEDYCMTEPAKPDRRSGRSISSDPENRGIGIRSISSNPPLTPINHFSPCSIIIAKSCVWRYVWGMTDPVPTWAVCQGLITLRVLSLRVSCCPGVELFGD